MTADTDAPARTVNLVELAQIIGKSTNTLRDVMRAHDDFPVLSRGSNGVPYEFDADACAAWWRAHAADVDAADEARRRQISEWRKDLFGDEPPPPTSQALTPAERKAELEAQFLADKLRRSRGELIEAAPMEAALAAAVVELRNALLQIPAEFARKVALGREERTILEGMVERRLNELADRLGRIEFYGIDRAA